MSPVNVLSTLARVIFGRSLPSLYGFSSQLLMLNLAFAVLCMAAAPQADIILSTREWHASKATLNPFFGKHAPRGYTPLERKFAPSRSTIFRRCFPTP